MTQSIRSARHDTSADSQQAAVHLARRAASEILARWQKGEPADAQGALQLHPQLRRFRSIALNLVYEEYCQRLAAGEKLDREEFAARFPDWRSAVRQQLEVHSVLAQHPEFQCPELGEQASLAWPVAGEMFLGFALGEEIGRGAMARVFRARESAIGGRAVAVKISRHVGGEAKILGRLTHPNVVPIFSVAEDAESGLAAICMPYLGQVTLSDVLDELYADNRPPRRDSDLTDAISRAAACDPYLAPKMPAPRGAGGSFVDGVLRITAQLADALAYTHSKQTLHRDLKPSNILIADGGVPMLLDFNLSVDTSSSANRVGGTLPYMSPEQIAEFLALPGERTRFPVDGRSDIYALGVILYEMLTGTHPFSSISSDGLSIETAQRLVERQRTGARPIRELNPEVDAATARLVQGCLQFDPANRPETANELAASVRWLISRRGRAVRFIQRRPWQSAIGLVVSAVAIVVAGFAYASRPPASLATWNVGRECLARGEYEEASRAFRRVALAEPGYPWVSIGLGRSLQLQAEWSDAMTAYQDAFRQTADAPTAASVAYCALNRGDGSTAIFWYERAIALGYDNANVRIGLAIAYRRARANSGDVVLAHLDKAIEHSPENWRSRRLRASVLCELRNLDDAKLAIALADIRVAIRGYFAEFHRESPRQILFDAARIVARASHGEAALLQESQDYLARAAAAGFARELAGTNPELFSLLGPAAVDAAFSRYVAKPRTAEPASLVDPWDANFTLPENYTDPLPARNATD